MDVQRFGLEILINFQENSAHTLFGQLWTSQAKRPPLCFSVLSVFSPVSFHLDLATTPGLNRLPDFSKKSKTKNMNKQESCKPGFFLRNIPFASGL